MLLGLCNEDFLPADCQFGKADLDKLLKLDSGKDKGESFGGEAGVSTEDARLINNNQQQANTNTAVPFPSTDFTAQCSEERMDTSESLVASGASHGQQQAADTHAVSSQQLQQQREENASPSFLNNLTATTSNVSTSSSSTSIELDSVTSIPTINNGPSLGTSVFAFGQQSQAQSQNQSQQGPSNQSQPGSSNHTDKDPKKKVSTAMHAQLRQLKPLLTLSSRLGRALSELFVLLVKLSVGSPVRQRRSQQPPATPPVPSPAARAVAMALTKLLAGGLSFQPPTCSPQPKLRYDNFYFLSLFIYF